MKKSNFLPIILLAFVSVFFFACKDKSKSNEKEYSSEENKNKLVEVANKVMSKFQTADQQEAIDLIDGLCEKFDGYSWDGVEDYFENRYDAVFAMPRYLSDVAHGHRKPALIGSYTFSFSGESVIFEANEQTKSWEKVGTASDNSIILRCTDKNGKKCEAKVWGEGTTKNYSYAWYEDGTEALSGGDYRIEAEVPEKIYFTLTADGKEYARFLFSQDMQLNNHAYFSVNASVANLNWTVDTKINLKNVSAVYTFNYGSEHIISAFVKLPSLSLIGKSDDQTFEEWYELYEDQYEDLISKVGQADMAVDIINEVQLKGYVKNVGQAYSDIQKRSENYDDEDKASCDRLCNAINSNIDMKLYYDNTDIVQAQVLTQTAVDEWYSYYDNKTHIDYYPEQVLYFPNDNTTYAFETYFDSKPFTDLQYTLEDLINKYIRLSPMLFDEVGEVEF